MQGLGVIPVELADVDRGLDRSGALADASNNAHSTPWACQDLSARVGPGRGEITMAGF